MALRISTNLASVNAQRFLDGTQRNIDRSYGQLASGSRITKAADDAAGLSISETLKAQVRGYHQAMRNANDGISLIQVAEGGVNEISNILVRLKELGVQASSDTVSDRERGFINTEVRELVNESERIARSTRFGNIHMLDGSGDKLDFQIDINNDDFIDRISFDTRQQRVTTEALGIDGFDFSTREGARNSLEVIEGAQTTVNRARANLGAVQNRLTSTTDNLGISIEGLSAANSRIRDTDIAQASAELVRNNILYNATISSLAQANVNPQAALKLIG